MFVSIAVMHLLARQWRSLGTEAHFSDSLLNSIESGCTLGGSQRENRLNGQANPLAFSEIQRCLGPQNTFRVDRFNDLSHLYYYRRRETRSVKPKFLSNKKEYTENVCLWSKPTSN
jgi:hypothetical protein